MKFIKINRKAFIGKTFHSEIINIDYISSIDIDNLEITLCAKEWFKTDKESMNKLLSVLKTIE